MNKRKKFFIVVVLLLIAAAVWLWLRHNRSAEQTNIEPTAADTSQRGKAEPVSGVPTPAKKKHETNSAKAVEPTPESNPAAWIEKRRAQMEQERQKGLNEWRTPIEFYGMVVDERTNVVEGAQVDFDCNDLSPSGTSFYHTKSDANGLFSIHGISGKLLGVKVNKVGYYSYQPQGADFYYAGQNQNFVPDAVNPVIFRLKKKGVAEPLIHIQSPMGGPKGFRIAKDGTADEISLTTGKVVPAGQGDLRVQCWTGNDGKSSGEKYDWKCQISVPGGGILQSTNELDFQAPENGYQTADVIDMPASLEKDWSNHASRNYFLKLASGNYARISFGMIAGGDHFFQLESFLNSSGSRNLEFDPNLPINP